MMNSPTPLERTLDQVITKKESEILTQLNRSYLESINNINLSKSQIEEEFGNIILNAEKKAENLKRQVSGSTKLSASAEEPHYRNMLIKIFDESIPNMWTNDIIIECLKKDTDFFKKQIESVSLKYNKKIKIQGNLKNSLGGFKIKSSDGTVSLDNTLDSRIERLKPLIRKNIAQILRGRGN